MSTVFDQMMERYGNLPKEDLLKTEKTSTSGQTTISCNWLI